MDDRARPRRHERIPIYDLGILEPESNEPIGLVVDVSLSGMRTIGPGTLVVGAEHRLRLELPPELEAGPHVEITARVRWRREARIPQLSLVGWEFSGVTPIEVSRVIGDLVLALSP